MQTSRIQDRPQVVVVGAGIAGLAAADAVRRARPDAEVVVLEASDRVGGKLLLGEVAGVPVDLGAESILNRRPEGVTLAREHGLGDQIVHPATIEARIWSRGKLRRMPRSVLGVPADLEELTASGVLSPAGLARALTEPELPPTELPAEDVSVGWLVEQRFGGEVVDRLIEPLLGGVYAGHARELSVRAAAPQVVGLLDRAPSMTAAAAASQSGGNQSGGGSDGASTPVFAGLRGGVGRLATAVAGDLDVRLGTAVRALRRTASGWALETGPAVAPDQISADAVILAVPGRPTARLLTDVAPTAAQLVGAIEYASMAVITLAYPAGDVPALPGSGFLVPPVDGRHVKAATFSFAKWDWVREAGGEVVLLRASIGRHREEAALQVEDSELVARAVADLQDATGIVVRPVASHVQRWGGGLPQYAVGHLDRVRRIRTSVADAPGLAVCGAAYDGLGIPACIASGQRAAEDVVAALPPGERMRP